MQDDIRTSILEFAFERGENKTFCPSEVARKVAPEDWRSMMQEIREVGIQLAKEGIIEVTQKGKKVDLLKAKGPIRFKAMP